MKKDFHYSVIKILAIKAGFAEEEAQIIAHASQYVDDATTHQEVRVANPPGFILEHPRYDKNSRLFDPICTAHKLLGFITGIFEKVQKEVYVSFHFIPDKDFDHLDSIKQKHYVTRQNGELANKMMEEAVKGVKAVSPGEDRIPQLIKLGIVLHSYADTWAHQGFSGRHAPFNDIKDLKFRASGQWKGANYGYRPDIGHAEADDCPDLTHLEWTYGYDETNNVVNAATSRDNPAIFMDASKHIFDYLCRANGKDQNQTPWDSFKEKLNYCLGIPSDDSELKKEVFKQRFPDIELFYNENIWKNEALNGKNDHWFHFHVAAYDQRLQIANM